MIQLNVNGKFHELDVDPDMPLLWVVRDHLGLTGSKYSCGLALCGACTMHLDGYAIRACVTPVIAAKGKRVTTIEGIDSRVARAVQTAWKKIAVPQCGFCQSGQIMTAIELLNRNPHPSDQDIIQAMDGNICRCNTYDRIHQAISEAASTLAA